jgi:hypothetical protein
VERKYQDPFEMFPIPTQNARSTKDKFFLLKQGSGSPSTKITKMQICIASSLTGLQRKGFHQLNSTLILPLKEHIEYESSVTSKEC